MENILIIEEIFTVSETAAYLKVGKVTAYSLFHSTGFPYFRVGRSLRICKTDLLKWVKSNLSKK